MACIEVKKRKNNGKQIFQLNRQSTSETIQRERLGIYVNTCQKRKVENSSSTDILLLNTVHAYLVRNIKPRYSIITIWKYNFQ